jgi:hypothetical protein
MERETKSRISLHQTDNNQITTGKTRGGARGTPPQGAVNAVRA